MNLPDIRDLDSNSQKAKSLYVIKAGETGNFEDRIKQHATYFGKIEGVEFRNLCYTYMIPEFRFKAEGEMLNMLGNIGMPIKYRNHEEMFIINKKQMR